VEEWLTLDNMRKAAALLVVGVAIAVPMSKAIKCFWQRTHAPAPHIDTPSSPDKKESPKVSNLHLLKKDF